MQNIVKISMQFCTAVDSLQRAEEDVRNNTCSHSGSENTVYCILSYTIDRGDKIHEFIVVKEEDEVEYL